MAYDLTTKKKLWRYEHKLGTTIFCCGPNNRGVAITEGHVYMGTLDARLVASMPRPAQSCGTKKSPIPPSDTASPTHRSSSGTTSSSACPAVSTASAAT
jgi:hypothetical protein